MNWEAISAFGEMVGAVGVIISLVYVGMQIRHNTKAMMATSAREAVAAMRDFNKSMVEDISIARIFRLGAEDLANLNEDERGQFGHILFNFFKTAEELHYQYLQGTLDPEIWKSWRAIVGMFASSPGFLEYWEMRKSFFTPAFQAEHDTWKDMGYVSTEQFAKRIRRKS